MQVDGLREQRTLCPSLSLWDHGLRPLVGSSVKALVRVLCLKQLSDSPGGHQPGWLSLLFPFSREK